jgi:hypothetical protein
MKSVSRRDVDDIALSSVLSASQHHLAGQPMSSYGRKDIDDMVKHLFVKQL